LFNRESIHLVSSLRFSNRGEDGNNNTELVDQKKMVKPTLYKRDVSNRVMKFDNKNRQISFSPQIAILWYSIIAGVLSAGLMAFVVLYVESQERAHIDRVTQSSANGIKTLLEDDIQQQITLLAELADSSNTPSSTPLSQVSDDDRNAISQALYDTQYGYQAITWINSAFQMREITPIKGQELSIDLDLALRSPAHASATKAKLIDTAMFTIGQNSKNGNLGFVIYVPVYKTTQTNKDRQGFIGSVLTFNSYLDAVLPSYLLTEHQLTLFVNEQRIYSAPPYELLADNAWVKQSSFELGGQIWRVELAPKSDFLFQTRFYTIKVLIMLGALLSLFVGLALYSGMVAVNKAKVIKDDRKKTNQLLKNLPGMAYQALYKTNWPMLFVSDGCLKLTGYTKQQFEQHKVMWGNIIHPDDCDRVRKTVSTAADQKRVFELEYRIITQKNGIRFVWEKGESVCSTFSEDVIIEGFITDVTSIKQVEFDLKDSDAFSDTIVNSVVEAVITIDQRGLIKSFNDAAQLMFGYTFAEIKNQALSILMPKPHAKNHDSYIKEYLRTNQAHIIGEGRELLAKRKDGTTFPMHLSVSEFQNHGNKMFVGLVRDITQQRDTQDQIRLHTEELAHADRLNALGEMAAGVAHEINQPLTAISLYSQTAKNLCDRGQFEKLPAIFEKMSRHARRAGAVLESVQIMTKQGERVKEVVSCQMLINEVLKLTEAEARLHDIKLHSIVPNKIINVPVDRVQIQQVILNLLRNAMEAMQSIAYKNGSTITLKAILKTNNILEIAIADTGCGLSETMTDRLFTPFSSTKTNGTGIGLSISKRIIEEHSGHIDYAPNKPAGAIFFFTLPVHEQGGPNDKPNKQ
jgi:two-component system sensor kinase FixL